MGEHGVEFIYVTPHQYDPFSCYFIDPITIIQDTLWQVPDLVGRHLGIFFHPEKIVWKKTWLKAPSPRWKMWHLSTSRYV
jgi:hypothetical protein